MPETQTQDPQARLQDFAVYRLERMEGPLPTLELTPGRYIVSDERGVLLAVVIEEQTTAREFADLLHGASQDMRAHKIGRDMGIAEWWTPQEGQEVDHA